MLSHLHRFHGHGSLRYVYRHGASARGKMFGIKYTKNANRIHPRFAIIVSKKIFKSAVKRNRLRRRLYEAIYLNIGRIAEPYDIAITVFDPQLKDVDFMDMQKQLLDLLEKEGVIS